MSELPIDERELGKTEPIRSTPIVQKVGRPSADKAAESLADEQLEQELSDPEAIKDVMGLGHSEQKAEELWQLISNLAEGIRKNRK